MNKNAWKNVSIAMVAMQGQGGKMVNNNVYRGRALRIAVVTMLVFLVFMGVSGALSDAAVSDNAGNNYSDLARLNGNFPGQPPGRPLDLQRAEQFSTPTGAKSMSLQTAATDGLNITRIGHFGGFTYAVEVSGNYAYTSQGGEFVVLDINNKSAPAKAGSIETNGFIVDIELAGNYAYVADDTNGLVIIDISNPEAPTLKGSYNTAGTSQGVAVAGNYAYVADDTNGLVIIDISNPAAPTLKGSYDTPGYSRDVAVEGNYAYVADYYNGLVIIDISNPAAPILKGSYDTPGYSWGVIVAGNYAYVADAINGLVIIDVSNPAVPTLKGSYDTPGFSTKVAMEGNYAYVADAYNGLIIINVSNPEAPTLKGSYNTAGASEGVAVAGNYAYVADYSNGLVIIDVSNPAVPTLKGSYYNAGFSRGVAVEGNYAYVTDDFSGLVIVDVNNPAAPTLKSSYYTADISRGVALAGNYAYVADASSGLVIVDVSNPEAPTLKGSYNTDGYSLGVAVAGNYAYVADYSNGLVIVDVSNPEAPTLKGSYHTAGSSQGVAVAGNYAYLADDTNGLIIVDVSNPAAPTLKGSYLTVGSSQGVAVVGNYVYVADAYNGLVIIDVSNPEAPTLKGNYYTTGYFVGVAVEGNYAYVADGDNGLVIIDVSNPEAPTLKGSYHTAGTSQGVAVAGNYVYVADGGNGLGIFRIDISTSPGTESVHNINKGTNYTTIQDAINDATQGNEIQVDSGTYYENVNVDKQLILRGIGMPVVDAGGNGSAITLAADGIIIEGFTAIGGGDSGIKIISNNNRLIGNTANSNKGYCGDYDYENGYCNYYFNGFGIHLYSSSNNKLIDNNVSNNQYGISIDFSNNNTLSGNNVSSNSLLGIYLGRSNNNTLSGNNALNNDFGIELWHSSKSVLMNNIMNGNTYNFDVGGDSDSYFDNQIDTTNLVDGKPVYYIKHAKDLVFDSYTNAGTFYCISCVNVTLKDLDLKTNSYLGIFFWNTTHSKIQNVTASKNQDGIMLSSSSNNMLSGNNASNNGLGLYLSSSSNNTLIGNDASNNLYGIYLDSSSNNKIYHNNIINNTNQAQDNTNTNFWDNGYPSGGNYWSNYTGVDLKSGPGQDIPGSDGIGDTPYSISGGAGAQDRYPFMSENGWIEIKSTLSKIVISGSPTTTLTAGGKQLFTAIALDENDNPLEGIHLSWTVSNSSVGNVESPNVITNVTGGATSTFTALVAGTTLVNATNGSVTGTAVVTVKTATLTSSITVVSPNGEENWMRGTTQIINWTSTGSNKSYVKIELLKPGVANKVITASTLNDGSHPWLIPVTQIPGTDYTIKITNTTNAAYNDTSDNTFTIPDPTITVVSPNGTESWIRGTIQTIKWNSSGSPGAYVKIELLKAGMANKVIIASTLNDGIYAGLIPATLEPGNDYKVRITSTTNASYNDTSDNSFTILTPSFTVVSPNGGENWTRGTTQTIRWNSTENPKSYVKIELLKPGVGNKVIVASTLNDGSHPWLIPANQVHGTDYKVKITSTVNVSNSDTSDNNFTIPVPSFTVISPNGDENWTRGTTQTIRWNSTESPKSYVKIEILKSGVPKVIIASTLNDGSHPWLIPAGQIPGNDYKIRVTSTINISNNDTSDNNFTIPVPSFTIVSPNGLENWTRGTTQTIRWNSTENPKSYVKIELLKPGVANKVIISSTLNDGSHPWLIPATQTLGADYKIRITSTANVSNNDTSDKNFSIIPPKITVTSPDGNENWITGTVHAITWNYTGNPGTYVKIELLKGGVLNRILLTSTPNDRSQSWTIPAAQAPGEDYKIRITSTTNAAYNDTSDSNFTIAVPIT